jgi:hypothetical protein
VLLAPTSKDEDYFTQSPTSVSGPFKDINIICWILVVSLSDSERLCTSLAAYLS